MRLSTYLLILVCFMLTLTTAKSSLQDRPTKSTANQKYVLLKPISAALSYVYYTTIRLTDTTLTERSITDNQHSLSKPHHHNGPVAALALVLFFCVLTF
ncbi:hypothetical protein BC941DRAFT_439312 [Chlamydoabsidia padenii]|nr:hypothetical protein BC941DRAFT_439312 [Chlamydoabsidia padenii]